MKRSNELNERRYKSFLETQEYEQRGPKLSSPLLPQQEYEEKTKEPRKIDVQRKTIHRMLNEKDIEPLKRVSPKVMGNLFDRVDFLRERMAEIKNSLNDRKILHESLITEIDTDIEDKQSILGRLSDIDDIRDFKLDISALRMEKRRENVQYWRDVLELRTELRELLEQFKTESKIADLFKDLQGDIN
jgi:hypothetical protein